MNRKNKGNIEEKNTKSENFFADLKRDRESLEAMNKLFLKFIAKLDNDRNQSEISRNDEKDL